MERGAGVLDCSNWIYSAPDNLLVPGPARVMGEGWETSRRCDEGNDWVMIRLATAAVVRQPEIDTSFFVGNAPGEVSVMGIGAERTALLARTPVQPDAVNRFVLPLAAPVNQLRVDIFPDGGLARFRAWGEPSSDGRTELFLRWYNHLSRVAAATALTGWVGADETLASALAAGRPYWDAAALADAGSTAPGTQPESATWSALTGLSVDYSPGLG